LHESDALSGANGFSFVCFGTGGNIGHSELQPLLYFRQIRAYQVERHLERVTVKLPACDQAQCQ
jgi:hypothetical protein